MKKETKEEKEYREMVETIASNIAQLSRQTSALLTGRLKEKTLLILLANMTGQSQSTIKSVLDALVNMENVLLKK